MADYLNIAGRIRTTASDGVSMEAQEVKDLKLNKSQQEVNADVQTELGDRYTKEETYSKEQLDDLITTPDVNYVSVVATNATTAVTDILPATGEANTIYRVGNWNGTQYDPTMYALFAWNGTTYVCLAVRSFVGEVYDISANHPDGQGNPTPYADLAAALGTSGANIPADIRRGGMSIKFIQGTVHSSDNMYVQYRLMHTLDNASTAAADFANIANWQGVDDEPTAGSHNLVKSGGVATNLLNINEELNGVLIDTFRESESAYSHEIRFDGKLNYVYTFDISIKSGTPSDTIYLYLRDSNNTKLLYLGGLNSSVTSLKKYYVFASEQLNCYVYYSRTYGCEVETKISSDSFLSDKVIENAERINENTSSIDVLNEKVIGKLHDSYLFPDNSGNHKVYLDLVAGRGYTIKVKIDRGISAYAYLKDASGKTLKYIGEFSSSVLSLQQTYTTNDDYQGAYIQINGSFTIGINVDTEVTGLTNIEEDVNNLKNEVSNNKIGDGIVTDNLDSSDYVNLTVGVGSQSFVDKAYPPYYGYLISLEDCDAFEFFGSIHNAWSFGSMPYYGMPFEGNMLNRYFGGIKNTISSGEKYLLITVNSSDITFVKYTKGIKTEVDILSKNTLKGKKIVCFGDSLTAMIDTEYYRSYTAYLQSISGATILNAGIGGTSLRQRGIPVETPTTESEAFRALDISSLFQAIANNDFSKATAAANFINDQHVKDVVSLLQDIDWDNIDAITIFAGTNDWTQEVIGTSGSTDISTTLGAIYQIANLFCTAHPNIRVYYFNPIPRGRGNDYSDIKVLNGYTLRQLAKVLMDEFLMYHIPSCDMYNTIGINQFNFDNFFDNDSVHPHTYKGEMLIAKKIMNFLVANKTF